jgi:conflict system STAND superfamily ATPase
LVIGSNKGMKEAVAEAANEALEGIGDKGRKAVEALVANLVEDVADSTMDEPVPIVHPMDRKAFVKGDADRAALVDAFVKARLLTLEDGGRLRPTHEALLRNWPEAQTLVKGMAGLIHARHALEPLAEELEKRVPRREAKAFAAPGAAARERTAVGGAICRGLGRYAAPLHCCGSAPRRRRARASAH